jgi:hypothetical protein
MRQFIVQKRRKSMSLEDLEKLAELNKKGVITDEEFKKKKDEILNSSTETKKSNQPERITTAQLANGYRTKIKEGLIFLGLEIFAIISIFLYAIIKGATNGTSGFYHLIWVIPFLGSFAYALTYARALHDWYYESQNLRWYKEMRTLQIQLAIIAFLMLILAPLLIPIIILFLWIKLKKVSNR